MDKIGKCLEKVVLRNYIEKLFMKKLYLICTLITLPLKAVIVDLTESTQIVQTLIDQNQFEQILDEANLQAAKNIIDNYAPSEIAFECEVNQTTIPLVLLYFFEKDLTKIELEELAGIDQKHGEQIKIILINNKQLPIVAQRAKIKRYPTVLSIKDGVVVEKAVIININQIQDIISDLS